ncbi:MAG: inner membrane protein YpjD, partial [Lysobacter sp.]|nr:inner membrane protein YpjD [Lysobacter sp.]
MTIVLIAVVLYLTATGLLIAAVRRERGREARLWLLPANLAVLLHGAAHFIAWRIAGGADLHFFAALSLVGLGMAVLTAIFGAAGRMAALGVVVFPLAALMLVSYQLYGHVQHPEPLDW